MKVIVNEPQVEYKVSTWIKRISYNRIDHHFLKIENDNISVYGQSLLRTLPIIAKKKGKISGLRGKIKKLSEEKIDIEFSALRNEWERDF